MKYTPRNELGIYSQLEWDKRDSDHYKYDGFQFFELLTNDSVANLVEHMYNKGWNVKGFNN